MASRAGFKRRESLRRILKALPQAQRMKIRAALIQEGEAIVRTQKQLAPVRTGALRDSIVATPGDQDVPAYASLKSKRTTQDPELAVILSAGNSAVRYAAIVESGTERTPGRPFFNTGFRAHKREAISKIRRAARAAIKDAIKQRLATGG